MKKVFFLLSTLLALVSCKPGEEIDPATQSPAPREVVGKWTFGTFSFGDFWKYDGSYQGKAFEQAMLLELEPGGTYKMYVVNASTSYSCRTESFTYLEGHAKYGSSDGSLLLTERKGNYRGLYSCTPSRNFKRDALASELDANTYFYRMEKDAQGKPALRLFFGEDDPDGVQLKSSH